MQAANDILAGKREDYANMKKAGPGRGILYMVQYRAWLNAKK